MRYSADAYLDCARETVLEAEVADEYKEYRRYGIIIEKPSAALAYCCTR